MKLLTLEQLPAKKQKLCSSISNEAAHKKRCNTKSKNLQNTLNGRKKAYKRPTTKGGTVEQAKDEGLQRVRAVIIAARLGLAATTGLKRKNLQKTKRRIRVHTRK